MIRSLRRYTVIPRLGEILAETQKEKVTRMIVAFLRVSPMQPIDGWLTMRSLTFDLESSGEARERQGDSRQCHDHDRLSTG